MDCEPRLERTAKDAIDCFAGRTGFKAIVITDTVPRTDLTLLGTSPCLKRTGYPVVLLLETLQADLVNAGCTYGWFAAIWPMPPGWVGALIESSFRAHQARTERALRESFDEAIGPRSPWRLEDEVCWKTILGAAAKEIASDLGLKEKTVYRMRDRARSRVGVFSIADLRDLVTRPIMPDWRSK